MSNELQHNEPLVWRRFLVPGDVTLANLRLILQGAMGWHGGHLHEYEIARRRYGVADEDWPSTEPVIDERQVRLQALVEEGDRKSTRLNSSHGYISYAVFCLKKKKK